MSVLRLWADTVLGSRATNFFAAEFATVAAWSAVWHNFVVVDRESTVRLVTRALELADEANSLEEIRFNVASRLRLKHVKRKLIARFQRR